MKKVAVVYSGARYQGGVEEYLYNLFEYCDKKKVELILISMGEWSLCERIRKVGGRVLVLSDKRCRPRTFFDIKKNIKKNNISLVVSQGVVANFYARIGTKFAHVPHITTVHSDLRAEYPNIFINITYRLSDFLTKAITKKYIVVSEYLKKALISRGIQKDKIIVIYHGVRLESTEQQNNKETKQQSGDIVIGSLGRLDEVKGYNNLIEAFALLKNTNAKLMIWGEGKDRKMLERLIIDLKVSDKVFLSNHTEDIGKIFTQIDIYVQPSLSEGFGMAVVEAMLAKKPVIVTPVGALKEIVEDGETGFVAKSTKPKALAEAIKRVFDGFNELHEIVERAEKEAKERFSVDKCVTKTIDTYLEVIDS